MYVHTVLMGTELISDINTQLVREVVCYLCALCVHAQSTHFGGINTEAHTHKHTCTISTQEEWRQPGTGAWLREAEERIC